MINLLPNTSKAEIRAARANVLLVRYIMISLSAVGVLAGLIAGSYVVLNSARDSAQQKVNDNQANVSGYETTKQQADSFRSSLATAKSVLNQNISFIKLIYAISDAIPPNVILDSLTLDPATFGTKTLITASAKTFDDASKLKESFASKQSLFSSVQLQSIQSGDSSGVGYPVKVSLNVVINKGAAL